MEYYIESKAKINVYLPPFCTQKDRRHKTYYLHPIEGAPKIDQRVGVYGLVNTNRILELFFML